MKKGTVPVPLTAPALARIVLYNILKRYRILGEPGGGGENP